MRRFNRREFLAAIAGAGAGSIALAALPPWARAARGALGAPPAHADLIVRNDWPEHWETSIEALGRAWITPNDLFFVRSHFTVPDVDAASWRLEIAGLVNTPLSFTLAELRDMPLAEATHTLECAGNGRGLFHLASTSGTQWEYGAVGNAHWGGVRLAALLERTGIKPEAQHVWFEAADHATLPTAPPFLRSIPLDKALRDTLLAHAMNGAALPKLHGAPLRAIVPGWFGMASAKWVTRVRLEAAPSDNHFMTKGYRYVTAGQDPAQSKPVETVRVKSLITQPLEGARVHAGRVTVRGLAWAGPAGLERVEISSDGGNTWEPAPLGGESAPMAWRAWSVEIQVAAGRATLAARATDQAGDVQPMSATPNPGGYGNNSIHRVNIEVIA